MRVILSSREQFGVGGKLRQSETFQIALFSSETNDKIEHYPTSHYLAGENLRKMLVERGTLPLV